MTPLNQLKLSTSRANNTSPAVCASDIHVTCCIGAKPGTLNSRQCSLVISALLPAAQWLRCGPLLARHCLSRHCFQGLLALLASMYPPDWGSTDSMPNAVTRSTTFTQPPLLRDHFTAGKSWEGLQEGNSATAARPALVEQKGCTPQSSKCVLYEAPYV